ncbi:MAG TPA: DUF6531 domain-containing protein [Acidimicrobiia bacterium]|nr:DUF6531 domain-containing protein [Acidimicrobiia bacterium]
MVYDAMAADGLSGDIVLFGGLGDETEDLPGGAEVHGDTWLFDGANWVEASSGALTPRFGAATARLPEGVLLHGGSGSTLSDETWVWSGGAWNLVESGFPPGRYVATATWDEVRQEVLLFGGQSVTAFASDEMFSWQDPDWSTYTYLTGDHFGHREMAGFAEDPVNTASGNFVHVEQDLEFPDQVFGMDWTRSYNSGASTTGGLGQGWTVGLAVSVLGEDPQGNVTLRSNEGRELTFTPDGQGGFLRPDELYGRLVAEVDDSFRLEFFDGVTWDFDSQGRLASMSNWDGQTVTISYDADRLTSVSSSVGYSLDVGYDGSGRLSTVTSNDGRSVSYGYDASGLLTSYMNANGAITTYQYDSGNRLNMITDPEGAVLVDNTYDPSGRVVQQRQPTFTWPGGVEISGSEASFAYNIVTRETSVVTVGGGLSVMTYEHDPEGRLVGMTDPLGGELDLDRRGDGELTGATSRLDENLSQSFDANGNLLSSGTPTTGTSSFVYDSLNRVVSATSAFGATTTFDYEGSERIPSAVTDDAANVTSLVVADGLVHSVTDPDGVTTTYTYNAQRLLIGEADGAGNGTTYGHDSTGRLTSITSPEGNVTSMTYDPEGRLLTSTDPTGGVTTYTYDEAGRVETVTDAEGGLTTYGYDEAGRLATSTDARGDVTTFKRNSFGDPMNVIAPGDATTTNSWGQLARLDSFRDPLSRVTDFDYDADGNRTSTTDPLGNVTTTQHDTSGRVTSVTDPLGRTTSNTYDSFGRLISITDPAGGVTTYTYDTLGRVETVTDPLNGVTTTTYMPGGRVASVTDPNGLTTSYGYDAAGRLATVTHPDGGITVYGYDADGNQTSVTTPDGLTTTTSYDAAGRPLVTTGPDGVSITRSYDARGSLATTQREGDGVVTLNRDDRDLLSVTDAIGNTTSFSYDERGNRTGTTDALTSVSTAAFNKADERTSTSDALGRTTSSTYDDAGRIEAVADPSGRTVTNTYDAAGQLTSQSYVDGTTIQFAYDDAGRRTSITGPIGSTSYAYDVAGNLTSVTQPDGSTITYTYDPGGRRSQITYPDGSTVTYTYNDMGQILSAAHSTAGTAVYTYDADGRLASEELPDGSARSYTYTNGRLTSYTQNGISTTLSYDSSGRLATTNGGEDWAFGYDQAGQLTSATKGSDSYAYGYDPVGNLTSITRPGGSQTLSVDDANQLVAGTDGSGYQYDAAGRLLQAAEGDGSIRFFSYNARGLLVNESIFDPCAGLTPNVTGTEGDDNLTGTTGDDVILGLGGNDTIDGGRGNDIICAGRGDDTVNGDNGDDMLVGGAGIDGINGGGGADLISGGAGSDTLSGGGGEDQIHGGPGGDALTGDQNNDILDGGPDTESFDGGSGTDSCEGEPGTTSCESPLPDPLSVPGSTTIDRSHDGDGLLTEVTITRPDNTTDIYELLWDRSRPIAQVLSLTHNETASQLVYGPNRAFTVQAGAASSFEYSVLGDAIAGTHTTAASFGPYGTTDTPTLTVGFGYRGELHVGDLIYLRNRYLDPHLGRFTTADPLNGIPGTTTVANQYHYANNNPIELTDPVGLRARDRDILATSSGDGPHPLATAVDQAAELNLDQSAFGVFEDFGALEVAGFIPEAVSRILGAAVYQGDGPRGFASGPLDREKHRFFLGLDFQTGNTRIHVSKTCDWTGNPCWSALPVVIGHPLIVGDLKGSGAEFVGAQLSNWFYFEKQIGGDAVKVGWSVLHGDTSWKGAFTRVPFDGSLTLRPLGDQNLQVDYKGDCFPNVEAHMVREAGVRTVVMQVSHLGTTQGLAVAGDCKATFTGAIP